MLKFDITEAFSATVLIVSNSDASLIMFFLMFSIAEASLIMFFLFFFYCSGLLCYRFGIVLHVAETFLLCFMVFFCRALFCYSLECYYCRGLFYNVFVNVFQSRLIILYLEMFPLQRPFLVWLKFSIAEAWWWIRQSGRL
jgi:hypothetical protein